MSAQNINKFLSLPWTLLSLIIWLFFWIMIIVSVPIFVLLSFVVPKKAINILVRFLCTLLSYSALLFPKKRFLFDKKDMPYPVIFTANHVSFFDLFISGSSLPGYPRGFELEDHFKKPFYGWFITKFGEIPINPGNRKSVVKAFKLARDILKEKERNFFIMPEGTRTRDGRLKPFRYGAFSLSMMTGVPVIPVVYKNLYRHNNANSLIIKPGIIDVVICSPVYPRDFKKDSDMAEYVKKIMSDVLDDKYEN